MVSYKRKEKRSFDLYKIRMQQCHKEQKKFCKVTEKRFLFNTGSFFLLIFMLLQYVCVIDRWISTNLNWKYKTANGRFKQLRMDFYDNLSFFFYFCCCCITKFSIIWRNRIDFYLFLRRFCIIFIWLVKRIIN